MSAFHPRIVVAPDSFKHSMTAAEVCEAVTRGIQKALPKARVMALPVADGGEGTADTLLRAVSGAKVYHRVTGPLFEEVESYYGRLEGGGSPAAVIELAAICGLPMTANPNPEKTTTYGVGQMIQKALDDGCKKIILCIGGSATNDAGTGALAALGAVFRDRAGAAVVPCGGNLGKIAAMDFSGIDKRLRAVTQETAGSSASFLCASPVQPPAVLSIACDVKNPLYGPNGAAYVFAPQKGADAGMVKRLDTGLRHFAEILRVHTGADIAGLPGSGAAGGVAAGFLALSLAELTPGIELVLDAIRFDEKITGADLVITGEGKTDGQTLEGKAALGVIRRAVKAHVPVVVISGALDNDGGTDWEEAFYREGVTAVFSGCRLAEPFEKIKDRCPDWLTRTATNVMRIYFKDLL